MIGLQDLHLEELEDHYSGLVTDSPTVYLSFVRHGHRKTIMHYAPHFTGPAHLTAFENAVDDVVERALWKHQ